MFSVITTSPKETRNLGSQLGKLLRPGDFLNLNGDLGAGKTLLAKGVGEALGLDPAEVTSPTFAIINEYAGTCPIYHFDLYRLESELELEQIGYEDYFYGQGISLVEWGNLFTAALPLDRLDITLDSIDATKRQITFGPQGTRSEQIIRELRGLL